ncbi:DUF1580 domain-containing protein [Crateriforma spongiae]|uniref:DUF1580 domain-containing protein n=1 Tax=Crateriforma spongiae TaxID=2724528 RepID=UPI001447A19F|nr:DUF1580 domain-containing protein [Crateriforma spongiae]
MIDENKLISPESAVRYVTGQTPNRTTLWRWMQQPNRDGVVLESCIVGGQRQTTIAKVRQYIAATTRRRGATWTEPATTAATS